MLAGQLAKTAHHFRYARFGDVAIFMNRVTVLAGPSSIPLDRRAISGADRISRGHKLLLHILGLGLLRHWLISGTVLPTDFAVCPLAYEPA